MTEIAVLILGLILGSIPLISIYLNTKFKNYVKKCDETTVKLEETLTALNKLHNSAMANYSQVSDRIGKLETEYQAAKFGRKVN